MRSQTDCNQPSQKDIIRDGIKMEGGWKKEKENEYRDQFIIMFQDWNPRKEKRRRNSTQTFTLEQSIIRLSLFFSYSLSLSFCTLMCSPWLCHIYKLVVEEVCVCVDWTHIIFEKKKKKQLIMKWGKKHKNKKMKQKMMMKHAVTESVFPLFEIDFQITWQKDSMSA
jgi:hypothetical protein